MATGFKGVRVLFLLVPACLSAGGEASFVGSGSGVNCIGSLDSIRTSEGLVDDESVLRTYVLCPNTEFKLAEVLHQGKAFSEGQSPLLISKSNVRIQCGEDGSSSNNCVLVSAEAVVELKNHGSTCLWKRPIQSQKHNLNQFCSSLCLP